MTISIFLKIKLFWLLAQLRPHFLPFTKYRTILCLAIANTKVGVTSGCYSLRCQGRTQIARRSLQHKNGVAICCDWYPFLFFKF